MTLQAQPMLARRLLRLAVVQVLTDRIDGITVLSPGNWPTPAEKLPAVLVKVSSERKQSKQRGMPEFDTTCTVTVEGRVSADTPEAAQDAIEDLGYRVEEAILKGFWINQVVQQFASIATDADVSSEGKTHLGGFRMTIECEVFEAFDPTVTAPDGTTWPLPEPIVPTIDVQGLDLHADMTSPFDASGTYAPGEFQSVVTTAPRTTGPDGRDEAALQINLQT